MSSTNTGGQRVTFSYQERAESKIFNTLNHKLLPKGIYQGGLLSKGNDTTVRIAPLVALFEDSSEGISVRVETTTNADISGANPTTPWLVASFTWESDSLNYADFVWKSAGQIVADDIVFGEAGFSGIVLDGSFDYSSRDDVSLSGSGSGSASSLLWDSGKYYEINDPVVYQGNLLFSLQDSNLNNTPPTPPTYEDSWWINIFGPALTSTNYVSNSDSVNENISALDVQTELNTSDLGDATDAATANELVRRDANADITTRLFKSTFGNQTAISGAIAFRVNASPDNYIRFCSDVDAIKTFLEISDAAAYPATSANTANTLVLRNASGNFSAGTVTAALAGNASTASKWATARTVSLTGDVTGSTSIDGSANASIATTIVGSGVADGSVSQAKLKTAIGTVAVNGNVSLPGGQYGFYPQTRSTSGAQVTVQICNTYSGTVFAPLIYSGTPQCEAQQRYVTASGEVYWVFVMRDSDTREVYGKWASPDHPSFGNGKLYDIIDVPFMDYDPSTGKSMVSVNGVMTERPVDIIVANPLRGQLDSIKTQARDLGMYVSSIIIRDYEVADIATPIYPDEKGSPSYIPEPVTIGLADDEGFPFESEATVVKVHIEKPSFVQVKKLVPRMNEETKTVT